MLLSVVGRPLIVIRKAVGTSFDPDAKQPDGYWDGIASRVGSRTGGQCRSR